jgi:hypothetical protein
LLLILLHDIVPPPSFPWSPRIFLSFWESSLC